MMILGTVGAFGFDDFPQPEVLSLYAAAGCKVVQAYRNRHEDIPAAAIRSLCDGLSLRIDSLHAHFGDDLDPSSEDETLRAKIGPYYEREAEYCLRLGGSLVVVHPSPPRARTVDRERRYAQLRRSFDELARVGERLGVRFAFENMPAYHPIGADIPRLVKEIAATGSDSIAFLLDVAHAHMTCGVTEAIRAGGRHIQYTHVCDNDGVADSHKLPFRGNLPWYDCGRELRQIDYQGVFSLEVFESPEDLRRLLNDEWKRKMQAVLNGEEQ
jgi:sugar phosphate isomerase/epimerase